MKRASAILTVQSEILRTACEFLWTRGFRLISVPVLSEKRNHTKDQSLTAQLTLYGKTYYVASTNTLEKVGALKHFSKVFVISHIVRIEDAALLQAGRHLMQFSTIDVEIANADYLHVLEMAEELVSHIIEVVLDRCSRELSYLGRVIQCARPPFQRLTHRTLVQLLKEKGLKADPLHDIPFSSERAFSTTLHSPVWVLNYPNGSRGFLDRVDPSSPDHLLDFDLILPEGYCELVSGGEREFTRQGIARQISRVGFDSNQYEQFLKFYDDASLTPSGGFGFGIERLTRYICGLPSIAETVLSPMPDR